MYAIRIKQKLHGSDIINVVHYEAFNADVLPTIEDLCSKIRDEWIIEMSPWLSGEISLVGFDYRVEPADPNTPFVPVTVTGLPVVGQSADNAMAGQVCLILDKRSNTNAPWRGSLKVGGIADSAMGSDGNFNNSVVTSAQAYADGLRYVEISPNVAGTMVIVSRDSKFIPAGQFAPVATLTANPNPGTLRSRRLGRGS